MIYNIINIAISNDASDIHLTNNSPPILRIDGALEILKDFKVMNSESLKNTMNAILKLPEIENYKTNKNLDISKTYKNKRLRIHAYMQKGELAFSIRLIPKNIPTLKELNLPSKLKFFTKLKKGLVLVTGTTGSGKSTTLAALINEINEYSQKHILTIEDPIEYIHEHKNSIISQREIGLDVLTFTDAIKAAMREDPDVLLLGELRDLETIRSAITMAETGHLVFATVHTRSVSETVNRIIDVFPGSEQNQIRSQFSNSIEGIISQELLKKEVSGRVPCCEIMVINDAIRNLIREKGNPNAILDQIHMTSNKLQSQTRIQSLIKLTKKKLISIETAEANLLEPEINIFYRLLNNKNK